MYDVKPCLLDDGVEKFTKKHNEGVTSSNIKATCREKKIAMVKVQEVSLISKIFIPNISLTLPSIRD